jgi:hypothetical protein
MYAENHGNTGHNVKHGNPVNIVSGMIGRDLIESTENRQIYTSIDRGIYHYAMRRCTIKGKRSGGAVISVTLTKQYGHASSRPVRFVRRLPPGFTERRVIAAVGRCLLEARDAKYIMDLREQTYDAIENSGLNQDVLCDLAGEVKDHTPVYSDMTEADCRFWMKWIREVS